MNSLWKLLIEQPLLALLLIGWIGGAIASAVKRMNSAGPGAGGAGGKAPGRPLSGPQAPRGRPDPEEVAREMRRILGLDELEKEKRAAKPASPAARPRPEPRTSGRPDVAPAIDPESDIGRLEVKVAPRLPSDPLAEGQKATRSGRAGPLARRPRAAVPGRAGRGSLVDFSNLRRAFVMAEVLGKPMALRDDIRNW